MLSLLLLACDGGEVALDSADTGADSAVDSGSTDDSGDTGRNDTDTDLLVPVTFTFGADASGHALALTPLPTDDTFLFDAPWTTAAIAGDSVTVELNDASDVSEIDPSTYPGTYGAFFLPSVFVDDGDAAHEAGETFVAVSSTYLLWLEGVLPTDFAALGLELGWNAVRQPADGSAPGVEPLGAVPVPLNLLPVTSFTIGGSAAGAVEASLAVIPWIVLDGTPVDAYLYDPGAPIGADTWAVTLDGAPPEDHYLPDEPGQVVDFAFELPLAYYDTDATDGVSNNDVPVGMACDDGVPVMMVWARPPDTLEAAYVLSVYGFDAGWQARGFAGEEAVPVEDPGSLTLDCAFE
jgi:hypothetical protein